MKKTILLLFFSFSLVVSASTYYVAPTGDDRNPGTKTQPWGTWQKAFNTAIAGDTVFFRGGTWYPTNYVTGNSVTIIAAKRIEGAYTGNIYGHDGTSENPICFFNYPGEIPILDCSLVATAGHEYNNGIEIYTTDYLHFKGLTVRNVYQTKVNATAKVACGIGAFVCTYLTFENMTVNNIGGRGFSVNNVVGQFGITSDSTRFINCDIYNCNDSLSVVPGNAADGVKIGGDVGGFYEFKGCRMWNCTDDGIDVNGNALTIIDNCWSFSQGFSGAMDGNGFKFGAVTERLSFPSRIVKNCIAAFNSGTGFFDLEYGPYYRNNSRIFNNTSYHNGYGFKESDNEAYPYLSQYYNNIAYASENLTPDGTATYSIILYGDYKESHNTWDANNPTPGSWPWFVDSDTVKVTDADFLSLNGSQLLLPRQADGSLPKIDFLRLASSSDLIDAGTTKIPDVEPLSYSGNNPDIGYSEYSDGNSNLKQITSIIVTGAGGLSTINTDGGTLQLSATILPAEASNKTVTWSLFSGINKATINSSGLVTALDNGTIIARAAANDGSGVYGTLTITISSQVILVSSVVVTGAGGATTINSDNGTLQLSAAILPDYASNKTVTWSISSGSDKASINSAGLVTALYNGTVIARATANDGSGVYGTLSITISNQVIPVSNITVTGTGGSSIITSDNGTLQLIVAVLPAGATNKTVTWSISNGADKASISSTGLVTALDNGTAIARATANDGTGVYGTLAITISNQVIPVTSISVSGEGGRSLITMIGGTLQLNASVLPSNATTKTVTWSISSGTDKASISSTGLVTAIDNGTAIAKATANDGSGVYGILTIAISNQVLPVSNITVTGAGGINNITIDNGTLQLSVTIMPANATNMAVTWSILSDTDKAFVSSTGLVTAIENGTIIVRATANDGSGVYGTLAITISNQIIPISNITVTGAGGATTITTENGTLQLNAAILPANATNKTVTWSISSGTDRASISSAGLVTAINNGTVAVRATANDGSGIFGTFIITISYVKNSPPVIVVDYEPSCYSGFVYEIDASGSYDTNSDNLTFTWTIPANISVSSIIGSSLKYLSPIVNLPQTVQFTLNISDEKTTQSKVVPVEILPYKPELEIAEISNVEASSFQVPYYPYNIIDGNIGTMWSTEGNNQWFIVQLKHPFSIQHVKLAFQPGQKRESYFDILGSTDKYSWETILTKSVSCFFSGDLQIFEFPTSKTGKEYNYIKFIGLGNSIDSWNYISELKIFGYRYLKSLEYENLPVKIYPNPAKEFVTIRIDEPTLVPDHIRIIGLNGSLFMENNIDPKVREFTIPINLNKGIYILQLESDNITLFTQKLVVK
jgi:uncharacterized protein YjdB